MDRDTITRTGARAPGVERLSRSHGGVALSHEPRHRARIIQGVRRHEGRVQTKRRDDQAPQGQAPFDKPALEPYWGKPAVRNLREDDGNVGIKPAGSKNHAAHFSPMRFNGSPEKEE